MKKKKRESTMQGAEVEALDVLFTL